MAEEDKDTETTAEPRGGLMKKLMFAGIGIALLGAGVVGGMTFFGGDKAADGADVAEETEAVEGPALYASLHPPLVVNFTDSVGESHFMQITMEVMARDQKVINSLRDHTAVIRNSLILLYSGANYEEVITREGKEKMLADGLAEIQNVMTRQIGEPGAEALYFTALVIQ